MGNGREAEGHKIAIIAIIITLSDFAVTLRVWASKWKAFGSYVDENLIVGEVSSFLVSIHRCRETLDSEG